VVAQTRRQFIKSTGSLAALSAWGLGSLRCAETASPGASPLSGLGDYDGVGLAELIKASELTPIELVEDVIRRTAQVNPRINAVLGGLFDVEKARARAAAELGDGPLSGVPVMLKNLTSYNEADLDMGSRLYARAREAGTLTARPNSPLVDAMERAGMIITGVTNSPELGLIDTTEPVLHGPTRNPWNPAHTAGGSSGGSGAAVAARIVPLAHANDGGGSIRIPACQNGVFGLKPTRGRELGNVSQGDGTLNFVNNLCVSRSVRDTAAFLSVVEKKDDAGVEPIGYVQGPSERRLKIALMMEGFLGTPAHEEVALAVNGAAELCRELGHEVGEIGLPIDGPGFIDAFIGLWSTMTFGLPQQVEQWLGPDTRPEEVLEAWTLGLYAIAEERGVDRCVEQAEAAFGQANAKMEELFETYDVMLSPVLRVPPRKIGEHEPMGDFETVLERVLDNVAYTPLQNATGMPGMSVPLHWTIDGLPVGCHFSAWRGQERQLLELAYELEQARPWADRKPPIHAS
jgi:amidase